MMIFVSGGSGSGKSAFAESLIIRHGSSHRAYIATMLPFGQEGAARIARHRALREGKGFTTYECPRALASLQLPHYCSALLEDLTNLFANEWFDGDPAGAFERVMSGIDILSNSVSYLVIVGNDIFSDGMDYDEETLRYLQALSNLNCTMAARADAVYEVVCGIPICHKGETL